MIRRHGGLRAEAHESPGPCHPIPSRQALSGSPAVLRQDLVIRRHPDFSSIAELDAHDFLLALVEPGNHWPHVQAAALVCSRYMNRDLLIDNVLDAMRASGHRVEDVRTLGQALVLHDLDSSTVADGVSSVL